MSRINILHALPRSLGVLDDPSASEFISHPDFQQVASFFLGCVFLSSLHYLFASSFSRYAASRIWLSLLKHVGGGADSVASLEAQHAKSIDRHGLRWTTYLVNDDLFRDSEYPTLMILMTIMFGMASLAQFGSLLPFSINFGGAQTACAFAVAWGEMCAQFGRILGLLGLGLQLRMLGVQITESVIYLSSLIACTVIVFVTTVLGSGVIRTVPSPYNFALCFRRHYLPTSLALSLALIVLEIYCLGRFIFLLCPGFLRLEHKFDALKDLRLAKSISLLTLDILTIVPSATSTTVLGDYIPFSIGACLVLAVFNVNTQRETGSRSLMSSYGTSASFVSFPTFAVQPAMHAESSARSSSSVMTPNPDLLFRGSRATYDPYINLGAASVPTAEYYDKAADLATSPRTISAAPKLLHINTAKSLPMLSMPISPTFTVRSYSVPVLHMPRPVLPDVGQSARQFEEQVAWSRHGSAVVSPTSYRTASFIISPTTARRISDSLNNLAKSYRTNRNGENSQGQRSDHKGADSNAKLRHNISRHARHSSGDVGGPSSATYKPSRRSSKRLSSDGMERPKRQSREAAPFSAPTRPIYTEPGEERDEPGQNQRALRQTPPASAPAVSSSSEDLLQEDLRYLAAWITTPMSGSVTSRTPRLKGPRPRPATSMTRAKARSSNNVKLVY